MRTGTGAPASPEPLVAITEAVGFNVTFASGDIAVYEYVID